MTLKKATLLLLCYKRISHSTELGNYMTVYNNGWTRHHTGDSFLLFRDAFVFEGLGIIDPPHLTELREEIQMRDYLRFH